MTRLLKILLRSVARFGGRSFSSAPALFSFPFSRGGRRKPASQESATWEQKTNRPKWWKLANSTFRIHFSLPLGTKQALCFRHFALVQGRSILGVWQMILHKTPQKPGNEYFGKDIFGCGISRFYTQRLFQQFILSLGVGVFGNSNRDIP